MVSGEEVGIWWAGVVVEKREVWERGKPRDSETKK